MNALKFAELILYYSTKNNRPLSNLKMLKIFYFVYCDFYKEFKKFIFEDYEFEAWHYGPVVPRVYYEYVLNAADPIIVNECLDLCSSNMSDEELEFIKNRVIYYSNKEPWDLVSLIHNDKLFNDRYCEKHRNIIYRNDIEKYSLL